MRLLNDVRNLTGNYHVKSGMYHYFRNEYKQAEEYFRKALKDEGNLTQADRAHARHYLTLSLIDSAAKRADAADLEGSLEPLLRAAEVSPGFPDIQYRLGRTYEELGRVEEAIAAFEQAIRCNRQYLDAHVALGFCLLRADKRQAAGEAFVRALDLKKQQIEEPCGRALALLEDGELKAAAELFHEAFLAAPELCEAYRRSALARLREEEPEKALAELDRALALCPKYPDLHNLRGIVLHGLDRLEEAAEAFRLSAALAPGYLVPHLNLAFTLIDAGENREAEAELEAILAEDPTEPAAAAKLEELRTGRPAEKRRSIPRGSAR